MSDPDKANWDKTDSIIRRNEQSIASSELPSDKPLARIEAYTRKIREERLDFIGRFKAGSIERKAGLETIRSMHEAQLEATKHQLKRAVDIEKERVDLIAKKYIFEITEEYLRDMDVMGIHNFQSRMTTLLRLNDETTKLLKQAESQDVPQRIKEMSIDAIFKKYKEFFERLTAEEKKLD